MHIDDIGIKQWLQSRMESIIGNRRSLSREEQLHSVETHRWSSLSTFLHKKSLSETLQSRRWRDVDSADGPGD